MKIMALTIVYYIYGFTQIFLLLSDNYLWVNFNFELGVILFLFFFNFHCLNSKPIILDLIFWLLKIKNVKT